MSTIIDAKFFYGYVQPVSDEDEYDKEQKEDAWSKASGFPGIKWKDQKKLAYDVGMYGVGSGGGIWGRTAYYLCIREAHFEVEWYKVLRIDSAQLVVKPEWDSILQDASKQWNIDLTGLIPGWHLVALSLR